MIREIEPLVVDIDSAWSRTSRAEAEFSKIATEFLSRPLDLDFAKLARSICKNEGLPEQRRVDQGFGQPAITLYSGSDFTVEALCWHTSTPAIHEHAFSGAFRMLTGTSVHSRYRYTETGRLGPLSLGKLELQRAEVLESGSITPIPRGSELIHANFHLDSPTLTLVVRTHQGTEAERTYLPPGVAYDTTARTPALHKRIELLDTMHHVGHPCYMECLHSAIRNSDVYDAMATVMRAGARVDEPTFQELTARLRYSHGPETDTVIRSLNEERRRGAIVRLRSTVVDPDRRFFLACLLSFSTRKHMLEIMTLRYGNVNAARERVCMGVAALLGGDNDRQVVFKVVTEAILDDVPAESLPKWAERFWERPVSGNEGEVLTKYYRHVSQNPLFTPLVCVENPDDR